MEYVRPLKNMHIADVFSFKKNAYLVDAANSLSPSPLLSHKFQRGFPEINNNQVEGDDDGPVYMTTYDNSKQADILGIKFRTKLETTKDILEDFSKRGW